MVGYRAARDAMTELGLTRAADEELVAIVETDACATDAIQVVLGCTIGKGNLLFRDYGKYVFTLIDRAQDRGLRLALAAEVFERTPQQKEAMHKFFAGTASMEEQQIFWTQQQRGVETVLTLPTEELFNIRQVSSEPPGKARIFDSVVCSACGERAMEPRVRLRGGQPVCLPCAEEYGRGW